MPKATDEPTPSKAKVVAAVEPDTGAGVAGGSGESADLDAAGGGTTEAVPEDSTGPRPELAAPVGTACPLCFPDGPPAGAVTFGCEHSA